VTIREFIEIHGIRASAVPAASNPAMADDEWARTATHWRVTLRYGRARRWTLPFSQGSAHTAPPSAYDVLCCVRSDASSIDSARDFEDWAGDLRMDTDSRKAAATYHACVRSAARLRKWLGPEAYDELMQAEE
jgi:hypothetical protein